MQIFFLAFLIFPTNFEREKWAAEYPGVKLFSTIFDFSKMIQNLTKSDWTLMSVEQMFQFKIIKKFQWANINLQKPSILVSCFQLILVVLLKELFLAFVGR